MKYRHWFWDFDGTLFNTYPRICRAFQKSLADAGIFEDCASIMPYLKRSLAEAAEHYSTDHISAEQLVAGYRLHSEEEDLTTMCSYEGVHGFLSAIIEMGGKNYIYTHRGESLFKALEKENLEGLFADIVTSLDGFPAKPAPDALLYLMQKHGLNPEDCVMVGDRTIDLMAGINAGMNALCVDPDGYCVPMDGVPVFHDYQTLLQYIQEH